MKPETVQELRNQFNNLVDVLESEGLCTSRECMCDTSAPIVKMNAIITDMESAARVSAAPTTLNEDTEMPMSRTVPHIPSSPAPSSQSDQPFIDALRVLVEYDPKYKFFVAHCLQTGNVVTADDRETAVDMIKELLVDEVSYAIVHSNLKNLFSSPAPFEVWKRWSANVAKYGFTTERLNWIMQ